ncbi:MAG: DNA polymerase III subunit gamma/tau, partial [Pseudomonadota bacterium]
DPLALLRDLAVLTHDVSVAKIAPEAEDPTVSPAERARCLDLAGRLPMRALSRSWQMLLKMLEEAERAPSALMAAEMAVIRLTHVAELPAPAEVVRRLTGQGAPVTPPPAWAASMYW